MFAHIPKLLTVLIESLLKNEFQFKSLDHSQMFQTIYVFLGLVRSFLVEVYKFNVNEQLFINVNQAIEQA